MHPQGNNPQELQSGEPVRPVLKYWRSQELPQKNDQEEEVLEENQTDMVDS